jgi:hypothetical protein
VPEPKFYVPDMDTFPTKLAVTAGLDQEGRGAIAAWTSEVGMLQRLKEPKAKRSIEETLMPDMQASAVEKLVHVAGSKAADT